MRTQVQFRSSKFPAYPGEEEEINPNLWGRRLAEYIQDKLPAKGIATGEIISEDWGWMVWLRSNPFPMWVGCGHREEGIDTYTLFIEPSKPTIRKGLFSKVDTTADVAIVADAIDAILTSDPEIHEIHWVDLRGNPL